MRFPAIVFTGCALALFGGCPQPGASEGDGSQSSAGPASLVAAAVDTFTGAANPGAAAATDETTLVSGSVGGAGDYALYPITAADPGEEWTVADASGRLGGSATTLICLFNSDYELLQREIVSVAAPLEHVVRASTGTVYVGVAAAYQGAGGSFRLQVTRRHTGVPDPVAQVVWLNFGGASQVRVHGRSPISFPAFDGGVIDSQYAGATAELKRAVVETVREDYAAYDVVVLSSDDGPEPAGPHATLHFGGSDTQLLGLADSVDQYNSDPWQTAVIYVGGFANFAAMRLKSEELGQMIGNVASHEFGHLLGLFHTCVPADLMDTTGTAWDLANKQTFTRATLEATVFPFGYENSPARLREVVGANPDSSARLAKPAPTEKMIRKAALRALVRVQLADRCGTCLHLDE